jgi:hypothetical protein
METLANLLRQARIQLLDAANLEARAKVNREKLPVPSTNSIVPEGATTNTDSVEDIDVLLLDQWILERIVI